MQIARVSHFGVEKGVWQQIYSIQGVLGVSPRVVYGGILCGELSGLISAITFLPILWMIIYGLVIYTKLHNFLYILYSA